MTDTHGGCMAQPAFNESNDLTRTNSRPMMISPNLLAALEYDEQTRSNINMPGSSDSVNRPSRSSGLPPPPRPKSSSGSIRKLRSPPTSPVAWISGPSDNRCMPHTPPHTSHSHSVSLSMVMNASSPNPYINPPPRIPHLMVDGPSTTFVAERKPSLPENSPRSSIESRESPRGISQSPVQTSSPESAGGSSESRPSFQRHLRYLSSLQKVEKLLVLGKALTVGKQGDAKARDTSARRASDAGLADAEPPDKLNKDVQPMMRQYRKMLVRGRSSSGDSYTSAPASPVIYSPRVSSYPATTPDGGELSATPAVAEDEPDFSGRSFGVLPVAGPSSATTRLPTRPLISHGRSRSAASTSRSNASSESSHEPPSTPNDPRISISSTIYQDSHYSIPIYPPFDSRLSQPAGRSTMSSSDRESFIDLASPTFSPRSPDFSTNFAHNDWQPLSHRTDSSSNLNVSKPLPPRIVTSGNKPPLPTSPKPHFNKRSPSTQPASDSSGVRDGIPSEPLKLPPTTNILNSQERAERVRKNRKLAQVFGHTPGALDALASAQIPPDTPVPAGLLCGPTHLVPGLGGNRKHQRTAVSMSVNTTADPEPSPRAVWPPPEGTRQLTFGARRHSSPFTPDKSSFLDDVLSPAASEDAYPSGNIEISSQKGVPYSDWSSHVGHDRGGGGLTSPTSFIDLSEEEVSADGISSIISLETPKAERRPPLITSPSSVSIYSFTSDELAEQERRRKRDKLARLHRFLGSRVPTDLVLGQLSIDASIDLPPVAPSSAIESTQTMDSEARNVWLRRRRSSSAAELGGKWSDDIDRLKEELNDREKAQNVKRAVKMEKMFGVAPPQTLYHTRATPSLAIPTETLETPSQQQPRSSYPPSSPTSRNMNQSAYSRCKVKKSKRPGTADSTEPLVGSYNESSQSSSHFGFSEVYEHYRHSLNSLSDIIDRDDKESLERLHDLIHGDSHEAPLRPFTREDESPPPTPKAERRRSLPSRTSMTSLSSEFSIAVPEPQEAAFQTRRRRAAKLTQFFGVNYRDLMSEILDSIEKGLEEERGLGTLKPDEVQELLTKLRKLKTKRLT